MTRVPAVGEVVRLEIWAAANARARVYPSPDAWNAAQRDIHPPSSWMRHAYLVHNGPHEVVALVPGRTRPRNTTIVGIRCADGCPAFHHDTESKHLEILVDFLLDDPWGPDAREYADIAAVRAERLSA